MLFGVLHTGARPRARTRRRTARTRSTHTQHARPHAHAARTQHTTRQRVCFCIHHQRPQKNSKERARRKKHIEHTDDHTKMIAFCCTEPHVLPKFRVQRKWRPHLMPAGAGVCERRGRGARALRVWRQHGRVPRNASRAGARGVDVRGFALGASASSGGGGGSGRVA